MARKSETPYPRPPVDWGLLWQVVKKHLWLFFCILLMACVFLSVGLGMLCGESILGWLTGNFTCPVGFSQHLFGLLFIAPGLFLLYFCVSSNFSSVSYYYGKGCLKRYGLNIIGTVETKEENTSAEDEMERTISYRYEFAGQSWQTADQVNNARVFAALSPEQDIPLRLLPYEPQTCYIRERAVLFQLKKMDKATESDQDNDKTGEPLISFDEE